MTIQEFYDKWNGKSNVGNTAENKGECVGLSSLWMDNFNIPHVYGHAKDLYANAPVAYFAKIPNTPEAIVQEGDIVVWGQGFNGTFGHTGVVKGKATLNSFPCFQQNDPLGSKPHMKTYNYAYVIGWLRPRAGQTAPVPAPTPPQLVITDQTKIPQIDNMEVQAIRSERNDMRRDLEAYGQTLATVREDAAKLALHITDYKLAHPEITSSLGKTLYEIAKKLG